MSVHLLLNGREAVLECEPADMLLDVLRDAGLGSVRETCHIGVCGACTVLVDGEPARACLMFAVQAQGKEIRTVASLARGDELHPLQRAFTEHHALQCGYCTPGFLMASAGLLRRNPHPSDDDIREALGSNICRCTGYVKIIEAVKHAAALAADGLKP